MLIGSIVKYRCLNVNGCLKARFASPAPLKLGSPVSAVVANLYMEHFERIALDTAMVKPMIWKRYVDDTLCIVRKGEVENLLDHLNSVRPSIQFTVEVEDGLLPFLDTLIKRKSDGSLDITVYRKNTHTDS